MPRLGYWLGLAHQGRGYGTEAVRLLVREAFAAYPAERIGAGVFFDNAASRRVLDKLGFSEAGRYETPCLARGMAVETADMHLTREQFEGTQR
jgi:RimJ/RimL family protein N-acetyltransferase